MSSNRVQTGTLTVVLGATGIGKTQLGIQFLDHGRAQEGERGVLFDMTSRGDNQSHEEYADRLCQWTLRAFEDDGGPPAEFIWDKSRARRDVCRLFKQVGRRVSLQDLTEDLLWELRPRCAAVRHRRCRAGGTGERFLPV
jgi:KaiC/GvpD/RAD55 family RecA-like ATPase